MFVLFCNMFGMIPYSFTVTSHIIVTFVLAAFGRNVESWIPIVCSGLVSFCLLYAPANILSYASEVVHLHIKHSHALIVTYVLTNFDY